MTELAEVGDEYLLVLGGGPRGVVDCEYCCDFGGDQGGGLCGMESPAPSRARDAVCCRKLSGLTEGSLTDPRLPLACGVPLFRSCSCVRAVGMADPTSCVMCVSVWI